MFRIWADSQDDGWSVVHCESSRKANLCTDPGCTRTCYDPSTNLGGAPSDLRNGDERRNGDEGATEVFADSAYELLMQKLATGDHRSDEISFRLHEAAIRNQEAAESAIRKMQVTDRL